MLRFGQKLRKSLGGCQADNWTRQQKPMLKCKTNVWHVSSHKYIVSEKILFRTMDLLILLMSVFFAKDKCFWAKIVHLLKAIV